MVRMPGINRKFSIRAAMLALICGGVVVALAAGSAAGWVSYREHRDRMASNLIAASRAVMTAVDNELDEPLAFVNGLSTAASFSRGEFASFADRARSALSPYGYILMIKSADGEHEYVNTAKPRSTSPSEITGSGAALPLHLGKPANAYLRREQDQWMALIDIPIENAKRQVLYVMVVGVPSSIFQRTLTSQLLPPKWHPVILDADWRVVARDINLEEFIGHKGAGEDFRYTPTDRIHEVHLLEGMAAISAHSHSSRYGWTTAIAISEADLFQQAIGPVLIAGLGAFIATALVIVLAAFLATYLADAIRRLAEMVRGFPESALAQNPVFQLHELSQVERGLHEAAVTVLDSRKQMSTEIEDMRRLNDLSMLLVREENSETCFYEIVKTAIAVSGADKGNMQLFDAASQSLKIVAYHGFQKEFLKFFESVDDHVAASCGVAMASNEQIIVSDVLSSEIFVGQPAQKVLLDSDVRACISTPLSSSKGTLLGVLSTHFRRPGKPSQRQIGLLNILARQAAHYLERKHSEETQQTILRELQHRSNNLLAVIQSIAHRSLHGDEQSKKAFEARLQALARANRALLRSNWAGVDLLHLVRGELEAFSRRVITNGVSVILSPQQAQNFALALHELATNSTKYGAFSTPTGTVEVSWIIEPSRSGSVLKFKWREIGGPPVSQPIRQGFGTQLLKNVFSATRLDYGEEGLKCEIDVRLAEAARSSISEASSAENSQQGFATIGGQINQDLPDQDARS
jgi:two-component sensor histidine kinase